MIYRFTLTYNGTDTIVEEPQGWAYFESEVLRDFDSHGTIYNFSSGALTLGFIGTGRTILEDAFQLALGS